MAFFKTLNSGRPRRAGSLTTGTLGVVARSVGYLQGGYYTGSAGTNSEGVPFTTGPGTNNSWSQVQLFNTIRQVGNIVYDTGYNRRYAAGISGNTTGYFSINDNTNYNKFNYISASASSSFTTVNTNSSTAIDLNVYSQAWILETVPVDSSTIGASIVNFTKVNLTTDTPTSRGDLDGVSGTVGTSRQAMNTSTHGFFINTTDTSVYSLNFSTEAVAHQATSALLNSGIQIPCGMSISDSYGYIVGMTRNVKTAVSGATVQSYSSATSYTYNFGESHSLVGDIKGYMMAGYSDTTGRYSSVQHALCQSIGIVSEATTILPDLVLPQSSGQMMQGF